MDYLYAYSLQKSIVEEIKRNNACSTVLFCQHYPVITLGRQAKIENILATKETLEKKGINIYSVDRGGDVTLHNPGQLVVYPIFNLHRFKTDLGWFLNRLEGMMVDLLENLSVPAKILPGLRGVWVGDRKIASIGIGVSHWITFHGIAINISNDLSQFSYMRPCGLDVKMTSLEKHCQRRLSINEVQRIILQKFKSTFNFKGVSHGRSSST